MNKLRYILLAAALVVAASAAELVLSTTSTSGGAITTKVIVGRIQADPAADGSITLQIIPRKIVSLADGTVLSDKFEPEWIAVKLSDATLAALNAEIATAKAAADAAKAAGTSPLPSWLQPAADAAKAAVTETLIGGLGTTTYAAATPPATP